MRQALRDRSLRGFAHRHPLLVNLILIVLVVAPGYLRLEGIIDQACQDRRDQKIVLRELVDLSDDGRGRLNLTSIPSFQDLSPETQRYLADLEAAANQSPRPSQFVRNALALLTIPDCD